MNNGSLLFYDPVFPGHLSLVLRDLVTMGPALGELGSGRHVGSDPDVAADNRAGSDPDAPEDIGACVDGHIIAENRMTRDALDQGAVVILAERQSAKGHALIETAVVSPITTPVPWSMKKFSPMEAPGWISMPVREWAISLMMRGMSGTLHS